MLNLPVALNVLTLWKMADKGKILKKVSIAAGIIAGFFLLVAVLIQLMLTPTNLRNMVTTFSSEYLNASVKMDTLKLHLVKNFPYITIAIHNGEIVSKALDTLKGDSTSRISQRADSLLKFKELHVALSLPQLLSSNVNIRRISVTRPQVYVYVHPNGTANYNIFKDISTPSEDTLEREEEMDMTISVNRVSVRDGAKIVYISRPDSTFARIALNRLYLRGNFSTDFKAFEFNRADVSNLSIAFSKMESHNDTLHRASARFNVDSLNVSSKKDGEFAIAALTRTNLKMDQSTLAKDFPFEINGKIKFDTTQALKGELKDFTVSVAKIPVTFNGIFNITPDSLYTENLCGKVENFHISEMFQYIPDGIFKDIDKIKTNAAISLDIDVDGSYNFKTGALPSVFARLDIPQSYIEFDGRQSRINELETHIKAYYSATNRDSAAIEINKFVVNGRGIQLALNGKLSDLATANPFVNMNFKGGVFLDTLCTLFPAKSGMVMKGNINADMSVKSRLANLNMYNIGNADVKGVLSTDNTQIIIPQEDFYAVMQGVRFATAATTNTRDASIKIGTKMLGSNITADSVYFKYKDLIKLAASRFQLAGHQAADVLNKDTATMRVYPFNGSISAKTLNVKSVDSTSVRMRDSKIKFSILPHKDDYTVPVLKVGTEVKRLFARDELNRISIGDGNITIQAILNKRTENKERAARMNSMLDSLQMMYPTIKRDSLFAHHRALRMAQSPSRAKDDFASEDMDFTVDNSLRNLIRQWNITGEIKAKSGRITTPYFPLRTRMQNVDFNFTTDKVEFENTKITAGKSQFTLTGKASGLRRAMLRNGVIELKGSIVSDTLNFNELLTAANSGMEFMDRSEAYKDSLASIADDDQLAQAINVESSDSTAALGLIVVPGNINAKFDLDVKHGIYSQLTMNRLSGEMIIKDRCLQINGFEALTNAGNASLSAFYATRSKEDLSTGFDLELKDVAIEKFIELMPGVDTLLPMLKSFEGKVNCSITATSKMDTTMNLILPSLRGVARITGENLVLMDGETFASIAKMLKFKNRDKNYIDRISVELLLNDNKIEVFPFIAQMDRYKFAISGTQNLDMSFNYSISILQSPIPFRVGVKLFGDMEDFDFKIGRAQYKSDKLPAFTAVIDSARFNLRDHIANIYRRGVDAALKSDEIDKIQKRKTSHDSQYTGQMDTLSKEEQAQLDMITPVPAPTPEPAPAPEAE